MTLSLRSYGERAVLIEAGALDPVGVYTAVRDADLPGVLEAVPAAATVLVTFVDQRSCEAARPLLAQLTPQPTVQVTEPPLVIEACYDGPDLGTVASLTGFSIEEVIARHLGSRWTVAFLGFAPGFAYLTGGDPALTVPRRDDPRPSVPAGSIALAAGYSAIYPTNSPGGWQVLGSTATTIWDVNATPPTLFSPGRPVTFVQVA